MMRVNTDVPKTAKRKGGSKNGNPNSFVNFHGKHGRSVGDTDSPISVKEKRSMIQAKVGDVAKIRFGTRSGEKVGKGLLVAKCGNGCLWILVFWPVFSDGNCFNTLRLDNEYNGHHEVGYSEICNGNLILTKCEEAITEYVGHVCERKVEQAIEDILSSNVANKLKDFELKEPKMVSRFYEQYVGQYHVPGQTMGE